jgi:hypothetical protein
LSAVARKRHLDLLTTIGLTLAHAPFKIHAAQEVLHMMRLAPLLFISMVVAIPGLLVLRFVDSPMPIHVTMLATVAVWLVLLIAALVIHGKRGLWLLVSAPFALFIPLLWAHLYFVCQCSIFQEEGDQRGDFSITDPEQQSRLIAQRSD